MALVQSDRYANGGRAGLEFLDIEFAPCLKRRCHRGNRKQRRGPTFKKERIIATYGSPELKFIVDDLKICLLMLSLFPSAAKNLTATESAL